MATRPKRAGTRRCWKDTTRAFSAITIHTGQPQIQQREAASTSISTSTSITMTILRQKNQPLLNYQRSRYFHTSPFVGAKPSWELDNDNIDPNDPDAIPDFLDDEDFANSLRESIDATIEENGDEEREQYRLQQQKVNEALDNRKGRPWRDPWEISEQQWMSSDTSSESLPDWSPSFVSRISLERLQILTIDEDGTGGIPTLQTIAELSLPGSDPGLHPAVKTKTYAAYRKSQHYSEVRDCVERLAKARVATLLKAAAAVASSGGVSGESDDTHNQQDVVDALFEDLQKEAKTDAAMDILSKHPKFPDWVDRGLEEYLRKAEKEALLTASESKDKSSEKEEEETTKGGESNDEKAAALGNNEEKGDGEDAKSVSVSFRDETPVFMDCYDPTEASGDGSSTGPMVPSILTPLGPHRHGGPGRMVEEWELSAHSTTKRIMLRECTQKVAGIIANADVVETTEAVEAEAPKIYVHGRQGVGKSAVLASIVASSRKSGYIVLYLPDGDRLRKNGFFITPSSHPERKGMFDLQDLSQEALQQLVGSHDAAEQMEGMVADRTTLEVYFKDTQFKRLDEFRAGLDGASENDDGSISLLDLIAYSQENKKHAPMCYSVVVNRLMHQTDKKFMIVMDEFNCLFDKGHYFHMAYDEDVVEPIPYDKISLFEPIMAAMDLTTKTVEEEEDSEVDDEASSNTSFTTSHTAVLVGTSESHAIRSDVNAKLTECAERRGTVDLIEVPRFSSLEADHVLANFEATGVGKLRLDRGDTLMNPQEMEYLKMASGSIGQKLLDVSIF